ncbi:hypothetical protein CLAFUW4_03492 [Fulvia fulva]|uniref:Uncharacterized protein n=1 Tax=Passalora fulva TaxID=5499 RepID=A0A9Q8P5C6_PASFU|nr:uncharacterized protein CLAFUR5_03471 [Fulvia fulva]KAK4631242.1 hypothetical protein CLAFUR4_03481 [Fulvia fulva]KAK4633820.1 hypothetical protein CLAFUR0_03486 [Fulvia fulva]UJO13980.1 hypothetical protein CLAFUR5_03471 [Fulvia fulva]WPV10839.1 hypothetical protein CLAFUW4_03492 [Fulvia fulva]WPV26345.1 hypothetical protein CLAFUW7_03484 [Fulvia fulva]
MSTSHHLPTSDAQEWRESVLSTRSLSYISNAGTPRPANPHYYRAPTRQSTLNSTSEYSEDEDLEMAGTQPEPQAPALNDRPELPDSVANSLLFELPREIRDRIYSLCLMSREALPVEWPRPRDAHTRYNLQPQLLRACRIIHDESAALLYTLNNMTFHHPSDANMFVKAIASSPMYGQQITNLSLHIKAQDMRIWMPYITSTDESRSLKADFPNLKELGVRFRSNKWAHQHTPDSNLKTWHEDSRLDEVIDGLRHVFMPESLPEPISERDFQEYMAQNPTAFQEAGDNYPLRKRLLELQKARAKVPKHRHDAPVIRVCCACRVHTSHFTALTEPQLTDAAAGEELPPPVPVREGEEFSGFTAVDLQNGVKRLHDPDLGSANVARTPYANNNGILIALEIHCLDPKKDSAERTA